MVFEGEHPAAPKCVAFALLEAAEMNVMTSTDNEASKKAIRALRRSFEWWSRNGAETILLYEESFDDANLLESGRRFAELCLVEDENEKQSVAFCLKRIDASTGCVVEMKGASRRRSDGDTKSEEDERCSGRRKKTKTTDVILLDPSSGYEILINFAKTKSVLAGECAMEEHTEPELVRAFERKLEELRMFLPAPELLVVVSKVFSCGKFPGWLLSKCELTRVPKIDSLNDAKNEEIFRRYSFSLQRYGK